MDAASVFQSLSQPIPCKWRLKTVTNKAKKPYPQGTRGQFLAYIDARDVFNRLDQALGPANWKSKIARVNEDGSVIVSLSVKIAGEWIEREDCGYPNNPGSGVEEEPLKAAVSDGVKRAAVQLGIGRFLYELPAKWVPIDEQGRPTQPLPTVAEKIDQETGEILSSSHQGSAEGWVADPTPRQAPPQRQAPAQAQPVNGQEYEQAQGREQADQPCAVEGCGKLCAGKYVGWSMRQYGAPLCGWHSSQAKKGELDLEALGQNQNARSDREERAPQALQGGQAQEALDLSQAWSAFWTEARRSGITTEADARQALGYAPATVGPAQALQDLRGKLQTGAAR